MNIRSRASARSTVYASYLVKVFWVIEVSFLLSFNARLDLHQVDFGVDWKSASVELAMK